MGIKRILRNLNGTKSEGVTITPIKEHQVDCYVDSDFADLFGIE